MLVIEKKETLCIEVHSKDIGVIAEAIKHLSEFMPYGEFSMSHKNGVLFIEFIGNSNSWYSLEQVAQKIKDLIS